MRILIAAFVFGLAGCSCPPAETRNVEGVISDISFQAAHNKIRSRAKLRDEVIPVPDTWFLNICDAKQNCSVLSIRHAPWKWMKEGQLVTAHWETYCEFGRNRWYISGISKR